MSISQRLIDRAYKQRVISEAETRPLRYQELSRRELKRVDATLRDLKTLITMTDPGRAAARVILARGSVGNHGPERLAVQVDRDKVYVVTRRYFGRGGEQVMMLDRQAVQAEARSKYATALALRNALADQINEQDWMITTLRGLANTFSGLLTRTT
ncbi:MAG: hypothetical protein ACAI38_00410 [Myxococcota bacterium]